MRTRNAPEAGQTYRKGPLDAPEAETAVELVQQNRDVLDSFARTALARGGTGRTLALICLPLDSPWRWLVDELMPGFDWEPLRQQAERTGNEVMTSGVQPRALLVALLSQRGIDIGPSLEDPPPPPGVFWVLVGFGDDRGHGLGLVQLRPGAAADAGDRALDAVTQAELGRGRGLRGAR